jgi:hypothetical protein
MISGATIARPLTAGESAIQQKLDKLDEPFLYSESIDVSTYGRQRDKLREELTLAKIDSQPRPSMNST